MCTEFIMTPYDIALMFYMKKQRKYYLPTEVHSMEAFGLFQPEVICYI